MDTPGFSILVLRVSRGPVSIPSICELCMKSGRGTVYEQHVNRSTSFQSMNLPVVDKKKKNQSGIIFGPHFKKGKNSDHLIRSYF